MLEERNGGRALMVDALTLRLEGAAGEREQGIAGNPGQNGGQ